MYCNLRRASSGLSGFPYICRGVPGIENVGETSQISPIFLGMFRSRVMRQGAVHLFPYRYRDVS